MRPHNRYIAALALGAALFLGACDAVAPDRLTAPVDAGYDATLISGGDANGACPGRDGSVCKQTIIGPSGGQLKVSGNYLIVPPGAVNRETVFRMHIFETEFGIGADLDAYTRDGATVESFAVPVTLGLAYDDWRVPDPGRLYLLEVGGAAVTGSGASPSKYVVGELWHFSAYVIASN